MASAFLANSTENNGVTDPTWMLALPSKKEREREREMNPFFTFTSSEFLQDRREDGDGIQSSNEVHLLHVNNRGTQDNGRDVMLLVIIINLEDMGQVHVLVGREGDGVDGGIEVG